MICRISDFFEDIWASYAEQDSQEQGVSTGWRGLDPYYRVRTLMAQAMEALLQKADLQPWSLCRWSLAS